ncbi:MULTISPECIES: AraC family transcriptional regulator [Pseudomonas]|jgi:AraC-like DNA-binding protein|uniref:AraC family transcriptional regulator n=1 Tax=Pseudomonas TaxID=286 RepID=UPI000CF33A18|nr:MULTISPECIES: AraC family transcriptional regulator [Pseudomonas]VVN73492.1 putative HTH-type transcriptional regulator [Pseudomonas fluorescens]MBC3336336.1 AraC family transcriptional regulator ligand-binding domain-containing protein [Pseudomonas proteolytica]NMY95389.1 helix-turn-helix domain-containing protein [Pseudomonas proteolytica]NMY99216.1 helix-turn-helix domain-containing protein [Pseudomonas proteolytica]NMZ21749.1 helix-turn-helix domain-containing protein [Pseudomonas prote
MHSKTVDPHYELALVSPFLLQTLGQVAAQKGANAEHLCRGLGFTLADLDDPALRISYRQAVAMIQRALKVLPDQGLGLCVGNQNVLGTLGLLGHVISLCKTLRDAFAVGERHQHTSGGIATSRIHEGVQQVMVDVECLLPFAEVQVFAAEEFFASLMIYGRTLVGSEFKPLRMEFMHAPPAYAAEYQRLFGDDVRFGCLHNRMVLEAQWLDVPLPNHHALALRQALGLLELESAQLHRKMDLIQAVERAISRDLQGSQLEKVASDLNMSGRTLRRRLTEHGLTFEALLEQVRRARCMGLLGNPSLSIERITQEVGYSDVRSFRRAFKRWTGLSPSAFRSVG